jgi:hypothetical protein
MQSSLVFHHTLRDSSALFEGVEYSKIKNVFVSVDSSALRLWSSTKQLKASHFQGGGFELLSLEYLHYFDCFLLIYYLRDSKVGYAELWDSGLKRIQRIRLGSMTSKSKCVVSPDKTFFIMTDNEEDIHCFNIIAAKKVKPKEGPWFPRASEFNQALRNESTNDDYLPRVQVRKVQSILKSSSDYSNIQVLHIFNDNCFAIIASRVLFLFKRLKEKEPFEIDEKELSMRDLSRMSSRGKSGDFSDVQFDDEGDEGDEDDEDDDEDDEDNEEENLQNDGDGDGEGGDVFIQPEQFPEDYNFVVLLHYESLFQSHGNPVSMQTMGITNSFLSVTFSNGYVGIYECGEVFTSKCHRSPKDEGVNNDSFDGDEVDSEPPTPVAFFKAHSPLTSSPYVSTLLRKCPWQTVPGEVYEFEFFSLGSDYKICHWGLRKRLDNVPTDTRDESPSLLPPTLMRTRSFKKCTYEIDLMGVRSVCTMVVRL